MITTDYFDNSKLKGTLNVELIERSLLLIKYSPVKQITVQQLIRKVKNLKKSTFNHSIDNYII